MKPIAFKSLCFAAAITLAAASQAHFIWGAYDPAEPGQVAFEFAEAPGDKTLPELKVLYKNLRGWCDGKELKLEYVNNSLTATSTIAKPAHGAIDYGVLSRGESVPYFLFYYAKAARNFEEAGQKTNDPFEIILTRGEAQEVNILALNAGKPASEVQLTIHTPDGTTVAESDTNGRLTIEVPAHGTLGVRARIIESKEGTHEGKAYQETRRYATITVPLDAYGIPTARLTAKEMLRRAAETRSTMPADVEAVNGYFTLTTPSGIAQGSFTWSQTENAFNVTGIKEEDVDWAKGQIANLFSHRVFRPFEQGDGRYEATLAEWNPQAGNLVTLNDIFNSSYRVRDNQIVQVSRAMDSQRVLINIVDSIYTPEGKVLASHFNVVYHDEKGSILRTQSFSDSFAEVEGVWLPSVRRMVEVSGPNTVSRQIAFHEMSIKRAE